MGCRAISPPPSDGWIASESGWDKNQQTTKWLRKVSTNNVAGFMYVPDQSRWADMPSRGLTRVDMCLEALAALRDHRTLHQQCFQKWKEQIQAVAAVRQRLQVMGGTVDDSDAVVVSDTMTDNFPLRTAFIAP